MERVDRRKQLLDVALALFAEKGYHATSIADIIEGASVARGTFYNYFESKRQIFGHLIDILFENITNAAFPIDIDSSESIHDQVRRLVKQLYSTLREDLPMAKVLMEQAVGLDADATAQLQSFYQRIFKMLKDAIDDGQEMGIVRKGNSKLMASCMLGLIKEPLYQHILGTHTSKPEDVVEEVFSVAASGVLA